MNAGDLEPGDKFGQLVQSKLTGDWGILVRIHKNYDNRWEFSATEIDYGSYDSEDEAKSDVDIPVFDTEFVRKESWKEPLY